MRHPGMREIIGGTIAILSVSAMGVIAVIQVFQHVPFTEPSALSAIAGAGVAVYLSNAGNNATAERMTDGFVTAVATAANQPRTVRIADLSNTPGSEVVPTVPPPVFPASSNAG